MTIKESMQVEAQRVKIVDGGKLVIPAAMRRALDLDIGDTVLIDVDDGELRVRSVSRASSGRGRSSADTYPTASPGR